MRVQFYIVILSIFAASCGNCGDKTGSNNGNRNTDVGIGETGGDLAGQNNGIPGLTALRIDPEMQTIVDDGNAPGETATFVALGTIDGQEIDVTKDVVWALEDVDLGAIVEGLFTSDGIGGRTNVIATSGNIAAQAELTVRIETQFIAPDVPANVPTLFPDDRTGDTKDVDQLLVVYPSHETLFPRNLERVTYQWLAQNLDAFELRFESDLADVRIYATGDQYLPPPSAWRWLADTHAGSSVQLTVRGTNQADPTTIYSSDTLDLYFSKTKVLGALYYWSTGAQGVMKAHISAPTATKFWSDPAAEEQECVSCHTVARNGTKMFVNWGGENAQNITVPNRDILLPPTPDTEYRDGGWATYSPDASRLLYSAKGTLWLLDADTGTEISQVMLPDGMAATHPDWSPSGEFVVVAYGEGELKNKGVEGTSIARIPVIGPDQFGVPEILVTSTGDDDTLFFPSYAPNSKWIAFVRTEGGSKDSQEAEIFLVDADGGQPIEVTKLNQRVRHEDAILEIGNTMPTWAPTTSPDDVFFLSISSLRTYGHILDGGRDQLWGAAIDLTKLAGGTDASYAAFWMPFQDLEEGNHRSFWVIDTEEECPSDIEICDDLDNDCDGVVDEDCCTIVPEICGDAMDNDCDGAIDEGCGCTVEEICTDGIDNDCDKLIDLEDVDCEGCVPVGGMCAEDGDCCSRVCGDGTCIVL